MVSATPWIFGVLVALVVLAAASLRSLAARTYVRLALRRGWRDFRRKMTGVGRHGMNPMPSAAPTTECLPPSMSDCAEPTTRHRTPCVEASANAPRD